ncbi:uncharacterized protein KQ657_003485 [Scheffersomyces spartinae]|uniref:Major facilitator superfamily (MFS) profile domain-containing protein n=1 Tax=Scheffersomyces spartinae TaxID=45513 RepID=A0A9P8AG81_9ASCO|nr:uncharacterized protein KQ657_003485 [Scheffersomyces spartinae]KAG7191364.1 hypothetical protein KQ657_003485 [Scheffersomyces spartinae]
MDIAKMEAKEINNVEEKSIDTGLNDEAQNYINYFVESAKESENAEKTMPLLEGIKRYPKATFWSFVLSLCIVMEGYDTNLLNSFYGFEAFQKKFGTFYPEKDGGIWEIPAHWQTTLSMCVNVGEFVGLFIAGLVSDRIGYRWTLIGSLMLVIGFIFILFFSTSLGMIAAGEILLGLPWGAFQTLTVTYASEVCPLVLRVYLTTWVNLCWVLGQLISSCMLKGFSGNKHPIAYQIPWAVQWVWPLPIAIGIYLAPESPWWLVKKGKFKEAKHSMERLLTHTEGMPDNSLVAQQMVNKIELTLKQREAEENSSSASYLDCFKNGNWRRTRIGALTWLAQNICGSSLMGYSTYFLIQAGMSDSNSFTFTIIQYVFGLCGTLGSWFLSKRAGRFTIYFYGLCVLAVIMIIVGILGVVVDATGSNKPSWGVGAMLLLFTFTYDLTVGPLCYCIVTEIPTSSLRTKSVVISRNVYNVAGIIIAVIMPYMLNPTAWNWKAKTGFFWAGFCIASAVWCWFDLPETKGRTFAELDVLFAQGVKSRKFRTTPVEIFNTDELIGKFGSDGVKAIAQHVEVTDEEEMMHPIDKE